MMKHTLQLAAALLVAAVTNGFAEAPRRDVPPTVSQVLKAAKPGQTVELKDYSLNEIPEIPYTTLVQPGPQFLISDDPEYIRVAEACPFRARVEPGRVRFYVYNVNGVKEPAQMDRKIVPVIKNLGTKPLHLTMLAYSSQPPSANYNQVGKKGLADFLASKPDDKARVIKPGRAAALDKKFDTAVVKYDELVHGFYEFLIDQPAEIAVLQTAPGEEVARAYARVKEPLPPKSASGAGRGLFGVSNYEVIAKDGFVLDPANGVQQLTVADGKLDPWVVGREETRSEPAVLKGNYGVIYDIALNRKGDGKHGYALVMWNARSGGKWCDFMAAAVEVNGEVIEVPADQTSVKAPPQAVMVKYFPALPEGQTETIHVKYSPPGASCLPTPLIFVPVE